MTLLIQQGVDTPIRPKDVESYTTFVGVFGKREAEVAAYWIVRYCQARRSWLPFNFDRLARFFMAHDPNASDVFYTYLLEGVAELVVSDHLRTEKKSVVLTTKFVARCYEAAPLPRMPRKRRPRPPRVPARSRLDRLLEDDLV